MASDWKTSTIFAALAAAAGTLIEPVLEAAQIPAAKAIAIVLAAVVIGVMLRSVVIEFLTRSRFWRRQVRELPAAEIEGDWLEVLNRRGQLHYSLVQVRYDRTVTSPSFVMIGYSYFPDLRRHSDWSTPYLKVERRDVGLVASYVYAVKQPGTEEITKYGYGETRFDAYPAGKFPKTGRGYYLAVEEDSPYKCEYAVHRIDTEFRTLIGVLTFEFGSPDSMREFVKRAHQSLHVNSVS